MKKLIALLLVAVMLLSLTACGGSAKPEETAEPAVFTTEAPTEPVETEPGIYYPADSEIDAALQDAEAPVLSLPSNDTYTTVMKSLGFNEVDFSKHIIMDERGYYDKEGNVSSTPIPSATVHNIRFLDDMVRVEFSWYELGDKYEEDGWVLYCTKAAAIADISGINREDYDMYDGFDFLDLIGEPSDFVQWWKYDYSDFDGERVFIDAYYYPESGNLYNLVKAYDATPESAANPQVLCKDEEMAADYLLNSEFELTFVDNYPIVTSEFAIICDDQATTYKYRVGMSLAAWAASELNTDGWVLGPDNMLFSPDHQYWLECTDFQLEQSGNGKFIVGIRSTAEHKNALVKTLETDTAAAYLVNWQTALLPTNFAVVGNHTEEVAYGMYDMAYGLDGAETLNLYMRNVHPSVLADVKVYAVKDNPEMQIPDDALCLSFVEAEVSGKDARFGQTMAVVTCDMTADGTNAFALTYQDKLVYWIQLG